MARFLIGPPVGGALYSAFGYRAPFIFGIIVTVIDFVGRLLIIERKDAVICDQDHWITNEVNLSCVLLALACDADACRSLRPWTRRKIATRMKSRPHKVLL